MLGAQVEIGNEQAVGHGWASTDSCQLFAALTHPASAFSRFPGVDFFRALDDDVFDRHVLVTSLTAGFYLLDPVHHILAFHHLAEYAVAEALRRGGGKVEEAVVR